MSTKDYILSNNLPTCQRKLYKHQILYTSNSSNIILNQNVKTNIKAPSYPFAFSLLIKERPAQSQPEIRVQEGLDHLQTRTPQVPLQQSLDIDSCRHVHVFTQYLLRS